MKYLVRFQMIEKEKEGVWFTREVNASSEFQAANYCADSVYETLKKKTQSKKLKLNLYYGSFPSVHCGNVIFTNFCPEEDSVEKLVKNSRDDLFDLLSCVKSYDDYAKIHRIMVALHNLEQICKGVDLIG